MASTITWIYADRLKADPERRHKVKGRTSFAFSDVRRLIAEAGLNEDFDRVCPKPGKPTKNSLVAISYCYAWWLDEFLGNFSRTTGFRHLHNIFMFSTSCNVLINDINVSLLASFLKLQDQTVNHRKYQQAQHQYRQHTAQYRRGDALSHIGTGTGGPHNGD